MGLPHVTRPTSRLRKFSNTFLHRELGRIKFGKHRSYLKIEHFNYIVIFTVGEFSQNVGKFRGMFHSIAVYLKVSPKSPKKSHNFYCAHRHNFLLILSICKRFSPCLSLQINATFDTKIY